MKTPPSDLFTDFIALAPGRYQIEATHQGEVRQSAVTIRRGEQRQVLFYFNTGDEVQPGRSP